MSTIRLSPGTNDHQRIQNALNQHEVVVLDYGAFYGIQGLSLPSGRQLVGQGINATFLHRADNFGDCVIVANNGDDVALRDLTILDRGNMPATVLSSEPCIRFYNCDQAVIERVEVANIFRIGMQLAGCRSSRISHCIGYGARGVGKGPTGKGGHGFSVWAPDDGPLSMNNVIEHCHARDCDRSGAYAVKTVGLRISNNTFRDCNLEPAIQAGVEQGGLIGIAHSCSNVTVSGNLLSGGGGTQGIEVDVTENGNPGESRCHNITITGNVIRDQGYAGVLIYCDPGTLPDNATVNCVISGNAISNTNKRGSNYYGGIFLFDRVRGVSITGNTIEEESNISHPGIRVKGPKNDLYWIDGNQVSMSGSNVPQSMGAALDVGSVVAPAKGKLGTNILTVRGKLV